MFNLILVLVAFAMFWFIWIGSKKVFYAAWAEKNSPEVEKYLRGGAAARKIRKKHWFL